MPQRLIRRLSDGGIFLKGPVSIYSTLYEIDKYQAGQLMNYIFPNQS